jgi:muramoyltetrapeptide carboxypeptidase
VAIISPSFAILSAQQLVDAEAEVAASGLTPVVMPHASDTYGYLAGTDADRAADIMAAFLDPEIKAIWCVRGGYGAARALPHLDFDLIRHNPKPLVGYSDHTALQLALLAQANLRSFHGVFRRPNSDSSSATLLQSTYAKAQPEVLLPLDDVTKEVDGGDPVVLRGGSATGRLVGGNLTVFQSLLGTPFMPSLEGAILFFEDVHEAPYRVDRMLNQLRQTGILDRAAGLLLGQFTYDRDSARPRPGPPDDGPYEMETVLQDLVRHLHFPVVANLPFGHIRNQLTLIQGATATISTLPLRIQMSH